MTYDSIVVGAGSAGATLAARLTEDEGRTVLLLETGPDYRSAEAPEAMRIPNTFRINFDPELARYRYDDLTARRAAGQTPRPYLRGKGMGGSSAINGQIAIRATPEDFAWWIDEGCAGWGWDDVLPAFNRLEDDLDFGDRPYHGRGGPIPIYRAPLDQWGGVDKALRAAALDLGYGWSDDLNAPDASGASPYAINSRDFVRVSTNDGYLEPARGRPNLTIVGEATVERLCLDGRRVTGVWALTPEGPRAFQAREVIVACGTIHSPGVLIRSGIGPAEQVRAVGVAPVVDLPVGANLIDHSSVWVGLELKPEGRVDSVAHRQTNCCVRYSSGLAGAGRGDMFMIAGNVLGYDEAGLTRGSLLVATYQTFSRGALRVCSADPHVQPELDFRMLDDERDLVRLRDGYRRLRRILGRPAVDAITDRLFTFMIAGEDDPGLPDEGASDAAIDAWLHAHVQETAHPVGTCRMGKPDDPRSVVDPECRVLGVDGLRVIDASVMPECPRANIHLTVVMLAERMAERLRSGAA